MGTEQYKLIQLQYNDTNAKSEIVNFASQIGGRGVWDVIKVESLCFFMTGMLFSKVVMICRKVRGESTVYVHE